MAGTRAFHAFPSLLSTTTASPLDIFTFWHPHLSPSSPLHILIIDTSLLIHNGHIWAYPFPLPTLPIPDAQRHIRCFIVSPCWPPYDAFLTNNAETSYSWFPSTTLPAMEAVLVRILLGLPSTNTADSLPPWPCRRNSQYFWMAMDTVLHCLRCCQLDHERDSETNCYIPRKESLRVTSFDCLNLISNMQS